LGEVTRRGGLRPNRIGQPNTGIDPKDDRLHFLTPAAFSVQPVNTAGFACADRAGRKSSAPAKMAHKPVFTPTIEARCG
jgi:hypothetical protein